MEMVQKEYASKGVAGTGLGLGAGALGLALLGNNGLGNLLGNNYNGCAENTPVTRYELGQSERIATLETEVKLRDANTFTDSKFNDLRNYVDIKFERVNERLNHVDVYAATNTATISCMQTQIATLQGLTKTVVPNSSVCPGWGSVCVQTIDCPTTSNVIAN